MLSGLSTCWGHCKKVRSVYAKRERSMNVALVQLAWHRLVLGVPNVVAGEREVLPPKRRL